MPVTVRFLQVLLCPSVKQLYRFLTLPENCETTIKSLGLSSLSKAIDRTDEWDDINFSPNYTCLSPNNEAFNLSGNIQNTLNESSLDDVIDLLTIPQPLYTNFLANGQEYLTDNNATMLVTIEDGDVYFNGAKVIQANIMYVIYHADAIGLRSMLN
jgi:uncharacterized surface protein with fasciclin (FAS1) repeats